MCNLTHMDSILCHFTTLKYSMNPLEYINQVLLYLDELDYPSLVIEYEPIDITRSMVRSMKIMYELNISPRMCALTIYGLTWENQILPNVMGAVKH